MSDQVYFAVSDGRVKIGTTGRSVRTRVASIGASLPASLDILGHVDGGRDLEQLIHKKLKEYRLKGEWFRDCDEVRRFIRNIVLHGPAFIGYEPKPKLTLAQRRALRPKQTDAEFVAMWSRVVRVAWPNDPIRELAAFSGYPEAECRAWLEGRAMPPRIVRYAFAGLMARIDDEFLSFIDAPPEIPDGTLSS